MRLRLLTLVWGRRHLDWYERVSLRSLLFPGNLSAVRRWVEVCDLVTSIADAARAQALAARLGLPVEVHTTDVAADAGAVLQAVLIQAMERALAAGSGLLLAPPDSLFGDGTLDHLARMAQGADGVCVAVPHVRVEADAFLARLPDSGVLSNGRLVGLAMDCLHRSWREAFVDRGDTNCLATGTAVRPLSPGLWAVSHRLPTPYLVQPRREDIDFLRAETRLGAWDHRWPARLVEAQRQRVVGSSDAAFVAELTDPGLNHPPCEPAAVGEPDRYRGDLAHHRVNRNLLAIWRAA